MKLKFILFSMLGLTLMSFPSVHAQGNDVNQLDARAKSNLYKPGEILVKFKTSEIKEIKTRSTNALTLSGSSSVNTTLQKIGVKEVENLMPLTGHTTLPTTIKTFNGKNITIKPMKNAYVLKVDTQNITVPEAVKMLNELSEVEYAEPNYLMYALETDFSNINDPYYNLQYGIKDINLDKLWGEPVLTKEGPVIAILDTGVDITHPDLSANIWTNEKEISGATGYDDDGNGFVDDIHGWDFVNQTGEIFDYNGHGTHCAGIAAASGFNGLGIIGANPDSRIMPLTVLQSNGQGDVGTIIKALDYAVANGADIISMSLGSYSSSIAFEEALGRAYNKTVLIAAAGNDGFCLNHAHPERGQMSPMPMYPGAYSFVLGVQASGETGGLASFSNYDDDGATYSSYGEEKLFNYELTVPGVSIMSAYPGGGYKQLNGTSMATPLVAGAISRLLQTKEYNNKEELFGDLIHSTTTKGNLDIYNVYTLSTTDRIPEIQFVTLEMIDTDGDGRADAGEVIEFYPVIRNLWGNVTDIKLSIESAETINNTFEIIEGTADFGLDLSSYGKGKSKNPLKIKLKDNVTDGRIIMLKFRATAPKAETIEQAIELTVENAVELTGLIANDMILDSSQHYVVTGTFGVPEGRKLTISPGTTIKFRDGANFQVEGELIANGTPNNLITFTKADLSSGSIKELNFGANNISYCEIKDLTFEFHSNGGDAAIKSNGVLDHCIISNIICPSCVFSLNCKYQYCQLYNIMATQYGIKSNGYDTFNYSNYINSLIISYTKYTGIMAKDFVGCNVFNNYYDEEAETKFSFQTDNKIEIFTPSVPNYLGTSSTLLAKERIIDVNHPLSPQFEAYQQYDLNNMPIKPYAEAPGIVWKILINGKDAQDEFDLLPPLGVGKHKFEVYFNRKMNKDIMPSIAMGVRPPYTSIAIGEDGSWNQDGNVYTAYLTINGKSNFDGLNRIYVAGAEDDEYFPIPVENSRFNVMVQAAGSLSDGFMAEAGLGRVNLKWDNTEGEFDDMLGLNMYRYTINEEGLAGDTIQINRQLIEPNVTNLTDYDVKPRQTYAYFYKVMRTDLAETSPSKTVAVTPMTATMGDANGSGDVDVADVITTVNYASGLDPKPFIFEAADMNADNEIDILDVVNIIRTILSPSSLSLTAVNNPAYYFIDQNGVLYLETSVALAGIQLNLSIAANGNVIASNVLDGFEKTGAWVGEDLYKYMVYSLNGKYLEPGIYAVAKITGLQDIDIRLSDVNGQNVEVLSRTGETDTTHVEFIESQDTSVTGIYTITGVKVGNHLGDLDGLPHGIYIVNGHKVVK